MDEITFDFVRRIPDGNGGWDTETYYASVNGVAMSIPIVAGNTEYDSIKRQVEAGTLTIQDPD